MKVIWLVKFNDRDVGFVGDVPDNKGENWIGRSMVELYKEENDITVEEPKEPKRNKARDGSPRDKMQRRPRGKK